MVLLTPSSARLLSCHMGTLPNRGGQNTYGRYLCTLFHMTISSCNHYLGNHNMISFFRAESNSIVYIDPIFSPPPLALSPQPHHSLTQIPSCPSPFPSWHNIAWGPSQHLLLSLRLLAPQVFARQTSPLYKWSRLGSYVIVTEHGLRSGFLD